MRPPKPRAGPLLNSSSTTSTFNEALKQAEANRVTLGNPLESERQGEAFMSLEDLPLEVDINVRRRHGTGTQFKSPAFAKPTVFRCWTTQVLLAVTLSAGVDILQASVLSHSKKLKSPAPARYLLRHAVWTVVVAALQAIVRRYSHRNVFRASAKCHLRFGQPRSSRAPALVGFHKGLGVPGIVPADDNA